MMDPNTRRSILLVATVISYAKKKRLGLKRNQIFNQGIFFFFWGGGGKAIRRIVHTSEKILATPLSGCIIMIVRES